MACEDIELRLSNLRSQKRDLEEDLDPDGPPPTLTGKARDLALKNLANIDSDIATEQVNLAECLEANTPEVSPMTIGYVGRVEAETVGTARLWFSLTESEDEGDWIKTGSVRAWFTMDLETADRPFFLTMLPLLMEAMRSGLQVECPPRWCVGHTEIESERFVRGRERQGVARPAVTPGGRVPVLRAAAAVVALLAVGAAIVALARPSVDETREEQRSTVMITLDVSESMLADRHRAQPARGGGRRGGAVPGRGAGRHRGRDHDLRRPGVGGARADHRPRRRARRRSTGSRAPGSAPRSGEAVSVSLTALQAAGAVAGPAARRPVRLARPHPGAHRRRQLDPPRHLARGRGPARGVRGRAGLPDPARRRPRPA